MWLEIIVGDAPILDRHVVRQKVCAVPLGQMRFEDEIAGQKAPCFGIPVHAAATDAVGRHERAPRADRQCRLIHLVAESERVLVRTQKQFMPDAIAQFVLRIVRWIVGCGIAPGAALNGNDVEAFVGEFIGEDAPRPSQTNDNHVFSRQFPRHGRYPFGVQLAAPMMLTGGSGKRSLWRSIQSR